MTKKLNGSITSEPALKRFFVCLMFSQKRCYELWYVVISFRNKMSQSYRLFNTLVVNDTMIWSCLHFSGCILEGNLNYISTTREICAAKCQKTQYGLGIHCTFRRDRIYQNTPFIARFCIIITNNRSSFRFVYWRKHTWPWFLWPITSRSWNC